MSLISTGIPPVAAPLANSAVQSPQAIQRGTEMSAPAQAALASQTAAMVSLSTGAKGRAPSSGGGKRVDSAFEKQELKETADKGKDSASRAQSKVDVEA